MVLIGLIRRKQKDTETKGAGRGGLYIQVQPWGVPLTNTSSLPTYHSRNYGEAVVRLVVRQSVSPKTAVASGPSLCNRGRFSPNNPYPSLGDNSPLASPALTPALTKQGRKRRKRGCRHIIPLLQESLTPSSESVVFSIGLLSSKWL